MNKHENHNHDHHEHHHGHSEHSGHSGSGHGHEGHDHGDMIRDMNRRFWITLIITVPVLALSPMIQSFMGVQWTFQYDRYVLFGLSSFAFFYGGWPFLKGFFDEVKKGAPGMMTLIAIAIVVAYGYSSAVVFGLEGKMFFWELVTLIDVMLLGHVFEMRSVQGASKAVNKLAEMMPSTALKVVDGDTQEVEVADLKENDIVLVKPGSRIPVDGDIVEGATHVDESMLTGESKPVKKGEGEEVIGGSVNGNSSIKVSVKKTGDNSYLSQVINLVEEAQKDKSKSQKFADKAAKWLAFIAIGSGTITITVWLLLGAEFSYALERMVTVMVISCPHALGLAIPLVAAISTSISAQNGLLIRNRTAFENARKISAMVFDKTGTLTEGTFEVVRMKGESMEDQELLTIAASIEQDSEHPIAGGILRKAEELELKLKSVKDFENLTGKGIKGSVDGREVQIVSPGYLKQLEIDQPEDAFRESDVETVVFVLVDGELAGYLALADQIREESQTAVDRLKEANIEVMMATGDNEKVAKAVSEKLGLSRYFAEVLPDEKEEIVRNLQDEGHFVAMTGDGVNDAPALARADIGIAVGSGTDVAAETADIILVESNPADIEHLISFGRKTYQKMVQNLVWATAYNAVALPLAAGVLFNWGIVLSPAVGAVLMSLSTIIVAVNARLLKYNV